MNRLKTKKFKDIMIIAVCLFVSFHLINNVLDPYLAAKSENAKLSKEKAELKKTNDELEKNLNQSENSTKMEEGFVRERFHLSKKDELIFVFPDE